MPELDPATQDLILKLAEKARKTQEEDISVLSSQKRDHSLSFWKEILAIGAMLLALIGFFFQIKADLDTAKARLEESRSEVKQLREDIKGLEKELISLKLDFVRSGVKHSP